MRIILLFSVLLAISCKGTNSKPDSESSFPESNQSIEISIEGMTCSSCESTIKTNISQLEGISKIEVSHTKGNALIKYNPELIDTTVIKEKIVASGYSVVSITSNE